MDCQHCFASLSEYIDGTLGARRSAEMREHLTTCSRCRREYNELLRLRSLLKRLPNPTPHQDFWRRAHAGVRQHAQTVRQSERPAGRRRAAWLAPLQARFAASVAPRAALTGTALAALLLVLTLTLPVMLAPANRPGHPIPSPVRRSTARPASPTQIARRPEVALTPAAFSPDSLVALHAVHDAALPLADKGRMGYLNSINSEEDLRQDGVFDIH